VSLGNVEMARRSFDGWNRGDFDAWLQTAHPEIEFFSSITRRVDGDETAFRGLAEMRRFWDEWHSVWNFSIEIGEVRDLGDTVVALGHVQTRGKASGAEVGSPVAYVIEFAEGLMRRVRGYTNPIEALEAVGLEE
jgi:ketosteroid isomerase-like protein